MVEKRNILISILLALLGCVLGVCLFVLNQPRTTAETGLELLTVNDKPLLTEAQKAEVMETDKTAFQRGNEWYVIEKNARIALKEYL